MCLIIAPGKDGKPALLPRDVFDYSYSRNKDGFGAMWIEDGRVQHFKSTNLTADEIYEAMEARVESNPEAIFHLRLRTHGKVIPGLSHPFRILNKNRHGKDLFFMHNGVLGTFGGGLTYGQSDTTCFKDKILIPLLTRDPDALDDPEVWNSINQLTSGSRLVFMDSDGKTYFTSPGSWNEKYGLHMSNTYMLPTEPVTMGFHQPLHVANDTSVGRPTVLTGDTMQVTGHFIYFRQIDIAGNVRGNWVSCPKLGYVRTESGLLYKDNGPNKKIFHAANYIAKDQEFKHLGLALVSPTTEDIRDFGSAVMNSDLDDDVPFDSGQPVTHTQASGPAPEDQRLRYARLVHNMYAGHVTLRPQLIADFVGMGDAELYGFVKEDPENASVALAELVEMVLEANDALWQIDPNHPKILNPDEIIRIGQSDYHKLAMLEITKARRAEYEEQVKKINEILDDDTQEEKVHVA